MTIYAKFKTAYLVLEPAPASAAPTGSIFNDSSNSGAFTNKTIGGSTDQVGATSSADIMIKQKRNNSGAPIPAARRVALVASGGSIVLADSDNLSANLDIGMSLDVIPDGSYGRVLLNGANAAGALTGLGFTTGQNIYLSKTPGLLTNSLAGFDPETDVIMRVGIADCATNTSSSTATDLIMTVEVHSSPGGA
jgi:hypothetical protein